MTFFAGVLLGAVVTFIGFSAFAIRVGRAQERQRADLMRRVVEASQVARRESVSPAPVSAPAALPPTEIVDLSHSRAAGVGTES